MRRCRPAVPATEGDSRPVLLDRCRAVSTLEKSIGTRDEAGEGASRRRVVSYAGDTRAYRYWRTGGQVVRLGGTGNRLTIRGLK
ncbi:hypothetical protein [Methanosphaerula subterraneus]|uniref:hypothetical protein n=1 Tax=Methanosphaerula subterraneus TaxID=3350244 RepID=UPI003F86BFE8